MPARPNFARRRAVALLGLVLLVGLVLALARSGDGDGVGVGVARTGAARAATAERLTLPEAVGQTLAGAFPGRVPPAAFLARLRRGELGAVILFGPNTAGGVTATRRAVDRLRAAAKAGGNPRLLVLIDQEGGPVKRLPGAPSRAAAGMTSPAIAQAEGVATAALLRRAGVDVDLAPVADVTRVRGSFLGTRSFGGDPGVVAQRACAFAAGLRSGGVAATLKHFPGLGRAVGNTDDGRITVAAAAARIRSDWAPHTRCAGQDRTLVMMSSASYPALLPGGDPAVLNAAAYARELRRAGVPPTTPTISDDLDAGAMRGREHPARRALLAGLDLLLYASADGASSARAYRGLLADARAGTIPEARVRAAAAAVLALKASLP